MTFEHETPDVSQIVCNKRTGLHVSIENKCTINNNGNMVNFYYAYSKTKDHVLRLKKNFRTKIISKNT